MTPSGRQPASRLRTVLAPAALVVAVTALWGVHLAGRGLNERADAIYYAGHANWIALAGRYMPQPTPWEQFDAEQQERLVPPVEPAANPLYCLILAGLAAATGECTQLHGAAVGLLCWIVSMVLLFLLYRHETSSAGAAAFLTVVSCIGVTPELLDAMVRPLTDGPAFAGFLAVLLIIRRTMPPLAAARSANAADGTDRSEDPCVVALQRRSAGSVIGIGVLAGLLIWLRAPLLLPLACGPLLLHRTGSVRDLARITLWYALGGVLGVALFLPVHRQFSRPLPSFAAEAADADDAEATLTPPEQAENVYERVLRGGGVPAQRRPWLIENLGTNVMALLRVWPQLFILLPMVLVISRRRALTGMCWFVGAGATLVLLAAAWAFVATSTPDTTPREAIYPGRYFIYFVPPLVLIALGFLWELLHWREALTEQADGPQRARFRRKRLAVACSLVLIVNATGLARSLRMLVQDLGRLRPVSVQETHRREVALREYLAGFPEETIPAANDRNWLAMHSPRTWRSVALPERFAAFEDGRDNSRIDLIVLFLPNASPGQAPFVNRDEIVDSRGNRFLLEHADGLTRVFRRSDASPAAHPN